MNKSKKLDQLVTEAEELFARLPDISDPGIAVLRDRLDNTILDTWTAITHDRGEAEGSTDELNKSLNDYFHAYPWLVMAATAMLSISASLFVGRIVRAQRIRGAMSRLDRRALNPRGRLHKITGF